MFSILIIIINKWESSLSCIMIKNDVSWVRQKKTSSQTFHVFYICGIRAISKCHYVYAINVGSSEYQCRYDSVIIECYLWTDEPEHFSVGMQCRLTHSVSGIPIIFCKLLIIYL